MTTTDVETALIVELNATYGGLGVEVSSKLPANFETRLPFGLLRRVPGGRFVDTNTKHLEAARLEVQAYDVDDTTAFRACALVIDGIAELEGRTFGGITVTAVDITQTPQSVPDPDTDAPRYLAFVVVYAHA